MFSALMDLNTDDINQILSIPETHLQRVPQNYVTKTKILGSLYNIYICVILNPSQIFVPSVEIIFFIIQYFLVFLFKYRTSSHESR